MNSIFEIQFNATSNEWHVTSAAAVKSGRALVPVWFRGTEAECHEYVREMTLKLGVLMLACAIEDLSMGQWQAARNHILRAAACGHIAQSSPMTPAESASRPG